MLDLSDLKPGHTLGRYEILMPVAHGGMAAVWAARMVGSRGFQKIVAVKTMLPALSDDPDFETMFLDEARLASRIHHPHVAEIVDLGDDHGWLYLVMEWVDGETIFTINKRAKSAGGIPLPLLLRILSNACAGLHAAHELREEKTNQLLGLVHRDVSPQNIMVSLNGIVKIVDFGVAKAAGRIHNTVAGGMVKGKIPYGSPEQLNGGRVDRRSDIFSLGILMYTMLSGLHPFRGESDTKTMENICTRAPVPLRELVPGVRPDIEAVVMRALEKDPDKRWPTCATMQRALDQALSALGTPVTDGDVADFVRSMVGDLGNERRTKLETAIEHADNASTTTSQDGPASRRNGPRSGSAGLPATFKGIIPVSLDDTPPPIAPPSAPSSTPKRTNKTVPPTVPASSGSKQPAATPATPAPKPTSEPVLFASTRAHRTSRSTYVVVGVLVLLGAALFAVRTGRLPWLADRLPAPVRELLLPHAEPPAPATPPATSAPATSETVAPSATVTASAEPPPSASPDPTAADAAAPSATDAPAADAGPLPSAPSGFIAPQGGPVRQPPTSIPDRERKLLDSPYD